MADFDFIALIEGRAELKQAKQDFLNFKQQAEQPIKLTFDTSGLNAIFTGLGKQAQQAGVQIAQQITKGVQNNVKNTRLTIDPSVSIKSGYDPISKYLKMDASLADDLVSQLKRLKKEGGELQSFKLGFGGSTFEAEIKNGDALVKILGELKDEEDAFGNKTGNKIWQSRTQSTVDYTNSIKQAQKESQLLADKIKEIGDAFSTGAFDKNITKMEQGLMNLSDSVSSEVVKKMSDAAAEYYKITQQIADSINNPNQPGALQGQDLADAYKKQEIALRTFKNAQDEARASTQKMLAEGSGARHANQLETWARNNSKALKKYGDQIDEIAQKMRNAKTQGELNDAVNDAKNLKAEITSAGYAGQSVADQFKRAFVHIGEFTGIYAFTSMVRQLPREMAQEVLKIDTAMTELRKVSTASASEISKYFEQATESAYKYGQTINEVIDSTAAWTRLGYDLEDASILTDVTAELAQVGSGLDTKSATEGLQATIRGFGLAAEDAKRVGDLINEVADTKPIDALGIINGLERSSAAMKEMNNSLEETIGLITATTSVTQDATSAGTAWRTKFKKRNCTNVQKCA